MNFFRYEGPLPANGATFRGRKMELGSVLELCRGEVRSYATVFGGRQNGKTSFLIRLAATLGQAIKSCRVDFQALGTARAERVYGYILQRVAQDLAYKGQTPVMTDAPRLIDALGRILTETGSTHFVLLIEEIGVLPTQAQEDLANVLRSIFTNRYEAWCRAAGQMMVVLSGGIELYKLAATNVSTLHNICKPTYLGDLSEEDAISLVREGLMALGAEPVDAGEAAAGIFEWVSGQPYLTQRLGHMLSIRLQETGRVRRADAYAAVAELRKDDPILRHLRSMLAEYRLGPALQSLRANPVRFSRLDDEMAHLELFGLAREVDGYWQVRNRLFAETFQNGVSHAPSRPTGPYHSCFISYSSRDEDFVTRLEVDLRDAGVECFFALRSLRAGERIRQRISEAIAQHDKLLLVLSKNSVASEWVEAEVETALDKERVTGSTALLPIRIDTAVMSTDAAWAALIRQTRHIRDFQRWRDAAEYQKCLASLLADLKITPSTTDA